MMNSEINRFFLTSTFIICFFFPIGRFYQDFDYSCPVLRSARKLIREQKRPGSGQGGGGHSRRPLWLHSFRTPLCNAVFFVKVTLFISVDVYFLFILLLFFLYALNDFQFIVVDLVSLIFSFCDIFFNYHFHSLTFYFSLHIALHLFYTYLIFFFSVLFIASSLP